MEEPVTYPSSVRIREVGPRDGIQSEKAQVPTDEKIRFLDALSATGLRYVEAASFVSPKAVPQMADSRAVFEGMDRNPEVFYSALVPNRKGAEIAGEVGADGLQVFIAATDSYNLRNVRKSVKDSLADVAEVVEVGTRADIPVQATISTAFGCPYEGNVSPERVVEVTGWVMDLGIDEISYGDTTGMGTPLRVRAVVDAIREAYADDLSVNMHFHDTRGTGLANVLMALELGIDFFDASVGGMGGSPFATKATGNIVTEDLVHMLEDMGIATGIDLDKLLDAARIAQGFVEGELPGKLLRSGPRWAVEGPITEPS